MQMLLSLLPPQHLTQHCFTGEGLKAHLRQIILSWLCLRARICREGSMMPPLKRSTRWSVDSAGQASPHQSQLCSQGTDPGLPAQDLDVKSET